MSFMNMYKWPKPIPIRYGTNDEPNSTINAIYTHGKYPPMFIFIGTFDLESEHESDLLMGFSLAPNVQYGHQEAARIEIDREDTCYDNETQE